tara:strand:+ start:11910 stop:12086 length:177 start_codon:yes stop_codon:yes gene_type:complete
MESDFNITHDEKELIIECLEKDIKRIEPDDTDNQMFIAWSECRVKHLQSLIKRIREDL